MAAEVYSISIDFVALTAPTPDISDCDRSINESAITEPYQGSWLRGDVVKFFFDNPLGAPDKALLDAIVAAHTGDTPLRDGDIGASIVEFGRAPLVTDDATSGFTSGSVWSDTSASPRRLYVAQDVTPGAAVWTQVMLVGGGTPGQSTSIDIVFADLESGDGAGIRVGETTYQTLGHFIWRGTTVNGTPTKIKTIAMAEGGVGKPIDIRIVDTTNGDVVVVEVSTESTVFVIIDMGAISNLSAGEAFWEIQGKRTSGGGTRDGRMSGIYIHF
jgi:hypothetical protein